MAKRSKKTEKQIQEMIRLLAIDLDMSGYTMRLNFRDRQPNDEPHGETVYADCSSDHPYRSFTVNIYPAFFDEPQDQWQLILKHELIHVIFQPLSDLLSCARNGQLVTEKQHRDTLEFAVDWIASVG